MSASAFGPSALVTPANAVTMGRFALTPVFIAVVVSGGASWTAFVLGFLLAATDGLDGYIARRQGTTSSGAFLDPLADKFLVLGAMVCLVHIEVFAWLPVLLIGAREVAMSVYRAVAGRSGVSIPASRSAKLKTVVQDIAVALAIWPGIGDEHLGVARAALWVAVGFTLYSGAEYLKDARRMHAM
jgi:CDP-diacylglycerol--glycerol-3-phosphate 3-phosphatidyltransferase